MPKNPVVTVFEAVNLSRREIFIAATTLPIHEVVARHAAALPEEIHHWRPDEFVDHRSLEFGMEAPVAADFIEKYAATQPGWRVIATKRIIG
jgi:hypothetical protein